MLHLPVGKDWLVNFLMYVCICLRSCKWVSTNLHNYIALIFMWKWFKKFQQISHDSWKMWLLLIWFFKNHWICWSQCLCKNHHFFAIQNCGKIIMLFDDQLHLGLCDSLNSFYCLVHVGKAFLDIFFVLLALERKKQAKTF